MDICEIASEYQSHDINTILEKREKFEEPSELNCIECGFEIPLRRRNVGGIKRCVDCQKAEDAAKKHYRGRK